MQGAGGVGGAISMTVYSGANTGTYFYCYDGNGNVAALVNAANGNVAAQYEYGPFGEVIRATGPMAKVNPFMFSTKLYDWETGLYYYGHRYYNPSTGRWPSRDPIGEKGGKNLYAFCGNAPIIHIDPFGNVYWGHVLLGALQAASGVAMWVGSGFGEVFSGGTASPGAVGLALWGTASVQNGFSDVANGFYNQNSGDAIQVKIATTTYQAMTGTPMSPTALQITRSANTLIDIATCGGSIRAEWKTASETGLFTTSYETTTYGYEVQKITSHLQFNWTGLNNAPLAGQAAFDYYSLWDDTYTLTQGIITPQPIQP
jgi:RHS repeat-associated protein